MLPQGESDGDQNEPPGVRDPGRPLLSSLALQHRRPSLILLLLLLLAACGHSGRYEHGVYRGDATYRVDPPSGSWRRVDVEDANDLAWVQRDGSAVIQVNGSCDPALDIPLVALTNHLLMGFTEREYVGEQELLPLGGREALRTHVRAKLDGVPRELLLFVTKKNECVYDFGLIAAPGAEFEAARPAFEAMVQSFSTRSP